VFLSLQIAWATFSEGIDIFLNVTNLLFYILFVLVSYWVSIMHSLMLICCVSGFYYRQIICYHSYVGNLDASVTEELLVTLFGQLGSCKGCKLIHEVRALCCLICVPLMQMFLVPLLIDIVSISQCI